MNITVIVSKALNKENWKKGVNYLNKYGVKGFIRKLKHLSPDTDYNKWFLEQRVSDKLILEQANYKFEYEPEISITIPLYNTKREFLKDIMDSIVGQSYQKWELCLADGSKTDDVEKYLREHYLSDSRIKYKRLNKNLGIAGNTNTALNMASGEFIMLADHDDVLEKDALFEIVSLLNKNRKLDIVYTDEDLTNKNGTKYLSPRFKPDFNINFLRSINYICHIFLVRKTILDKVGGFRTEFDGAQDWDLILRCCEQTEYIGHVPKILYHWRAHEGSTAGNPASKKYAIAAGRKAVEEHYKRLGLEAKIEDTGIFVMFRTDFVVQNNPKISIIICNKDQKDTLNKCIDSILNKSTYNNYEIIIVENNSTEGETFQYYNEIQQKYGNQMTLIEGRTYVINQKSPFADTIMHSINYTNALGDAISRVRASGIRDQYVDFTVDIRSDSKTNEIFDNSSFLLAGTYSGNISVMIDSKGVIHERSCFIDNYNFERHKLPNSYGFGKIMELNNAAALSMQAGKLKPFMWILYVHRTFSRFGESNEE